MITDRKTVDNLKQYSILDFQQTTSPVIRTCVGCMRIVACKGVLTSDRDNFGICPSCSDQLALNDMNGHKEDKELLIGDKCAYCRSNLPGQAVTCLRMGGESKKICQKCLQAKFSLLNGY